MPTTKRSKSKKATKRSSKTNNVAELRKIFDMIDTDGSGSVDQAELEENAHLLGFNKLTKYEIAELLAEADLDGDGEMDFDEFTKAVAVARESGSKWRNASVLAIATKRYNNVLKASDQLFSPLQRMVSASCEMDESGRRVAGCGRVGAMLVTGVLVMIVTIIFGLLLGMDKISILTNLAVELDSCILTSCRERVQTQIFSVIATAMVPLALYFLALGLVGLVGMTRSQAHLGHVLFGFQVIDEKTGKPASFFMTYLRTMLPTILILGTFCIDARYVGEVTTVVNVINYVLNPLMLVVHPKQQHVWDLILGQNVVIKD